MQFLWNLISDVTTSIGSNASTRCSFIFFEPEIPESLKEEE